MHIKVNDLILRVRPSSWKDYSYCYNLTKRNMLPFYKKHKLEWKPKSYRRNFIPSSVKILDYNERRIGFYKLVFKEGSWYLADLQISRTLRGKGVGTRIMSLLETIVKKKGSHTIKLKVFIDNPAVRFYKREGYKIIKKQDGSYLMIKRF